MKNTLTFLIILVIFACNTKSNSSETTSNTETVSKTAIVNAVLTDISLIENIEGENQIISFQTMVEKLADKEMALTKNNIEVVLETAKEFKQFIIITGDHTIVQIKDIDNCKQSGSWSACMPYGKGYIKKGKLNLKEDFINNIIGLPDAQKRTAYFFK